MSVETTDDGVKRWPLVARGDAFRIDAPPLPEEATESAMRTAKYSGYDAEVLPDGARIGYARYMPRIDSYSAYLDPDTETKATYGEEDGTLYEFVSCESHAYVSADEIDVSDRELFEEAIEGIHIGGDETFRLRIEVEEHATDYLGDRTVRIDHITQRAEDEEEAYEKLCERGHSGLGDLDVANARKFDHYDRETGRLEDPDPTSTSYVWVHTESGSRDIEILGRERGDL